jgi:hypothetical protein
MTPEFVGRMAVEVPTKMCESLHRGDLHAVAELARQAADSGLDAAEIGADRSSCNAGSAVESVKRLVGAA